MAMQLKLALVLYLLTCVAAKSLRAKTNPQSSCRGLSDLKREELFCPAVETPEEKSSVVLNPLAQPEEEFQNCTTPRNESGTCRYLHHCITPSIMGSLDQFMQYTCILNRIFIGVCCPNDPATVVVVKEANKTKPNFNEECGIASDKRIVGGTDAGTKTWPWMVALLKSKNKFFCGGALINDLYVLTAAHCTFDIPKNEITARLGASDLSSNTSVDYEVVEIKRHGHYSSRTLKNDIALLKLEKRVVMTEFVHTICLPEKKENYVGKSATLAGWGNIKGSLVGEDSTSSVLQEAALPVISSEACAATHGVSIPDAVICTAAEEKGACNGDSGGPLMLLGPESHWQVVGVVSWGRRGCSTKFPTVYTRVEHFLKWIKKHSKS